MGFLFYNADMLDIPDRKNGEIGLGFIDDVCMAACGRSFPASNHKVKKIMEQWGGCIDWSHSHHINFKLDKNALVQATRQREPPDPITCKSAPVKRVPVTIAGRVTKLVKSHKFLGIIIDKEMWFKEQLASTVTKGTKYTLTCHHLAKPSLGIKNKFTHLLFNSIVVPKMLYRVDVWGEKMVAEMGKRAGRKGQGQVLERVLWTHAITSSGAMRTTATDAAVAHANLTPMPFILQKVCHHAYLCMTTLPPSNPINQEIQKAACQRLQHKSPLHFLAKTFRIHPKLTEEILPFCHSPKWIPNVSMLIADKNEEAVRDTQRVNEDIQIFTDGSGYHGGIGAVAVLRRRGKREKVLQYDLSSQEHYMVFNGEQIGMLLRVELLRQCNRSVFFILSNQQLDYILSYHM